MNDRTAILSAIRSVNRAPTPSTAQIAKAAASLVADPAGVQPAFDGGRLVDRFVAKATSERVTATVDPVTTMADVPGAVTTYLKSATLSGAVCVQPCRPLESLDWSGVTLAPTLAEDGGIAVTLAEYGIAETGSVVFRSGADSPVLLNFLPLHHIVVLRAETMLAYPEDLWPLLGGADAPHSRLLTVVTGTSGTADIEAKNVRGAHGPRFMHVVLVG